MPKIRATIGVVSVCIIRKQLGLSCKNCEYYGQACEDVKRRKRVKRPSEIKTYKEDC